MKDMDDNKKRALAAERKTRGGSISIHPPIHPSIHRWMIDLFLKFFCKKVCVRTWMIKLCKKVKSSLLVQK
jgi:hypothetical protein